MIVIYGRALRTHPFNGRGHFGGFRGDGIHAANQYISVTYNGILNLVFGPRVSAWNYSKTAYTRMIDRNKPMVVFYETLDANKQPTGWGHGVVGVGYFGAYAVVRDPADALQKGKPFNMIRQLDDGLGTGTYFGVGDPPSAGFDLEWTRARLHVADVADFGDAPSSYEPSPSNFAGHQSGDREWLGPNISGEVDPDSPIDDPDGVANRTDQDQFDDGVVFTEFDQINGIQGVITVSSLADMSLDSAFEVDQPPTLFVDGWIDWNQDLTWSDPAERIVQWSGPADFQGTLTIPFSSPMPSGYTGLTWARFRLSRGAPSGPLGFSRFGEVEDYVCSYQLTLSATGLVAGGNATIAVSGATPGGTVRHGYSTTGGGPIGTPWGSLLLSPPYTELPAMTIDASGSGSFSGSVPPGTTGIAVWLHAFDLGSLTFSNGVATTIG